ARQRLLDGPGIDIVSPPDDELLLAPGQPEIAASCGCVWVTGPPSSAPLTSSTKHKAPPVLWPVARSLQRMPICQKRAALSAVSTKGFLITRQRQPVLA